MTAIQAKDIPAMQQPTTAADVSGKPVDRPITPRRMAFDRAIEER